MGYRNKTYIIFDADSDIAQYRLMTAWKENEKIDFDFHDAHELNNLTSSASEEQIKRKLRERLVNTKQAIVLVGESTKNLHKFVRWEIEVAIDMDLPIVAVNLDKQNGGTDKTPPILNKNAYFVSVPYEIKKIKYALDYFPEYYHKNKNKGPASLQYDWSKITL
ncbi:MULTISPECIES: TIR domain-containing protein [Aeromonas]|uniref:TIR domain-containing protein n=1 Tax=Aeromonas TaxID=642 RepID=UPI00227CA4FB|nr:MULTISPECIES: TIR domain-containing protein [Aeromonas]ELB2789774.1 TIR domain-containing protein [Aeromonas hydrophila]MCZ4331357.1 TIR domain-containing protein [Aeromonas hydrophila]WAF70092.1 TIR domain-containing protein [Aeromonas dhakensis]